ncbi:MAG TPA: toxin-antitoxin system YwqK family antitoxin [Saprospiraceae bacterium]|nr:toxin-antitoxin system YwqK family antitoxin [Saprospiraceae bacterium]
MEELILKTSDVNNKSPKMSFRGLVFLCCLAFLLSIPSCDPKPKEVLQYFEDGSVSRRHFEVNGKKEGLMVDYHANGKVKGERIFVNDLQEGRTIWFYPDGTKKETQEFFQGIQTGTDSMWLPSGVLQRVIYFENGKKHGPMRSWSEDGTLILEVIYQEDSLMTVIKSLARQDSTMQMQ